MYIKRLINIIIYKESLLIIVDFSREEKFYYCNNLNHFLFLFIYFYIINKDEKSSGEEERSVEYNNDFEIVKEQGSLPVNYNNEYDYDEVGNRIKDMLKNYEYDKMNRLKQTDTHIYGYDNEGNLILEKNKLTGEIKKFYYNSENRLIKYEHYPNDTSPQDIVATYKYDYYGRRLEKNVNGTITRYFWEGDNLAYELDSNNNVLRKYFYNAGIDNVEGYMEYSEVNFSEHYDYKGLYGYIKDISGTIKHIFSADTGNITKTINYDLFGNIQSETGTTNSSLYFQGKVYDKESGMYYFYHRYYKPEIGRFLNEDPIGLNGGLNVYQAFGNNPLTFGDPLGHFVEPMNLDPKIVMSDVILSKMIFINIADFLFVNKYFGLSGQFSIFGNVLRVDVVVENVECQVCLVIKLSYGGAAQGISGSLSLQLGKARTNWNESTISNIYYTYNYNGINLRSISVNFGNDDIGYGYELGIGFETKYSIKYEAGSLFTFYEKRICF